MIATRRGFLTALVSAPIAVKLLPERLAQVMPTVFSETQWTSPMPPGPNLTMDPLAAALKKVYPRNYVESLVMQESVFFSPLRQKKRPAG